MPNKRPSAKRSPADQPQVMSFDIAVTASPARPRHAMKHGDSFLVVDSHGDIGVSPGGPDGLFHRDTRYLSHLEMSINGLQPLMLGSNLSNDNCVLTVDLTNPDIIDRDRIALRKSLLHVARTVFVAGQSLHQRLLVRNYGADNVPLVLSLSFAADFVDVFEVRGMTRARRGTTASEIGQGHAALDYMGLDGVTRRIEVRFDPPPTVLTTSSASFRLTIEPQASATIYLTACCDPSGEGKAPFLRVMRRAHREMKQLMRSDTKIHTSNHRFNEMLRRATVDLAMLLTETPQGLYPYAGIPWYSTTFGRDGLITALQCLWLDRRIPVAVLKRLASMQATEFDAASDAEPGKILHETRSGEMASLREIPFGRYYGSVDATPLFVLLAGQYAQTSGDLETVRELWPAIEQALAWIDGPGDPDKDGFVEYHRHSDNGLVNQGWKDSHDAIFHADGGLAQRSDRAVRGSGLCVCGEASCVGLCAAIGPSRTRKSARRASRQASRAFRAIVLVRGTRHVRAGARREQAALPCAEFKCGSGAVQRHCQLGPCQAHCRGVDDARMLFWLGRPDHLDRRASI